MRGQLQVPPSAFGFECCHSERCDPSKPGEGSFPHCETLILTFVAPRRSFIMPERETIERAREDQREGKAPSTQAGEFVREEMHHIREGKHGARNSKQAIAIGLSKARRAGVKLPPPKKGRASARTRK